jgi:hypothetical protein
MEEIKKGQILTPDKKGILIKQVQDELDSVSTAINEGKYGEAALGLLNKNQQKIQDLINNLFAKKGVVTPQETNNALDILNTSKKSRLQDDYTMGMKRGTFYLLSFGIAAVAIYLIVKKSK